VKEREGKILRKGGRKKGGGKGGLSFLVGGRARKGSKPVTKSPF